MTGECLIKPLRGKEGVVVEEYAPTTGSSEEESNHFYNDLESCIGKCNQNEMLLIGCAPCT